MSSFITQANPLRRSIVAWSVTLLISVCVFPDMARAQSLLPDALVPGTGSADDAANTATDTDASQASDLSTALDILEDPERRAALAEQLRALLAAEVASGAVLDGDGAAASADSEAAAGELVEETDTGATSVEEVIAETITKTVDRTFKEFISLGDVFGTMQQWLQTMRTVEGQTVILTFSLQILAIFLAAFVLRWVLVHFLAGLRAKISAMAWDSGAVGSWSFTILLAVVHLVPLLVVALVVNLGLPLLDVSPAVQVAAILVINTVLSIRALHKVSKVMLVPTDCPPPPMGLSAQTRGYLYVWIRRFTIMLAIGFLVNGLAGILDLSHGTRLTLVRLVGLVILGMIFLVVLQNRKPVSKSLRNWIRTVGGESAFTALVGRFAELWHVFVLIYVTGLFITWFSGIIGGFTFTTLATLRSAIVIVLAIVATRLIHKGIHRLFDLGEDLRTQFPGLQKRSNRYLVFLMGTIKGAIAILAFLAVLDMWSLDALDLLTSETGQHILGSLLTIFIVLVIGVLLWEAVSNTADRILSGVGPDGDVRDVSQRVRTLVPLGRVILLILLSTIILLVVLSEMGLNIGPLLAGAGVIGLAISFGSQRLVQDVITGAFNLIEDTVAVGDVVNVGGHSGVVEGLSIRSVRLRDLTGSVHTVPFSSVETVTNLTKDFSFYVFEVGVGYREDTDEVCAVLTELGEEFMADPVYAPFILEPLEILGVDSLADSAVIIKARIKTQPIKQWFVGRGFNRLIKKRFDALGIEIPFPHTTIYFGEDKEGKAPAATVRVKTEQAAEDPGTKGTGAREPTLSSPRHLHRDASPDPVRPDPLMSPDLSALEGLVSPPSAASLSPAPPQVAVDAEGADVARAMKLNAEEEPVTPTVLRPTRGDVDREQEPIRRMAVRPPRVKGAKASLAAKARKLKRETR